MSGPQPPHWLTNAEQATWRAYLAGTAHLAAALNRQLENDSSMTLGEYTVLVNLSEHPHHRIRMSELAERAAFSRSRITHLVRRLESRGMVRRVADPADGRGVNCEILDPGFEALSLAAPGHVAAVRNFLIDLMSLPEMEVVTAVMRRVEGATRIPEVGAVPRAG